MVVLFVVCDVYFAVVQSTSLPFRETLVGHSANGEFAKFISEYQEAEQDPEEKKDEFETIKVSINRLDYCSLV
jgi:hypothetical protein